MPCIDCLYPGAWLWAIPSDGQFNEQLQVSPPFSSCCLRCHSSSSPRGKHRVTTAESIFTLSYDANGNLKQRTANTPALDGGPGDINADGLVNLADVTIVLKVLTGQAPNATIDASNSIDSNAQIGIKDAIYILDEMVK